MADKKKIVAVDDNPENLGVLKNTLKEKYTIFPVPSAAAMFELLEHVKPDLILLDVEMPEMSGHEAAVKLKGDDKLKEISFIFLTSRDDEESIKKGFSLGAVDYIPKPIVAPVLLERIEKHLS
jgi:Response regulators consisting of a CheY-like receiver domain and a winged-helix DNA-binding domain